MNRNISQFADGTKIRRQIRSEMEAMVLQGGLSRMHEWAVKWQIDFNIKKYSTLHVGRHKTENRYTINGIDIDKSNSEKDLRVL